MKNKKRIIDDNYPLLSIKTTLDQILVQASELPSEVKNLIASARDSAWACFAKENEKSIQHQKDTQKPVTKN